MHHIRHPHRTQQMFHPTLTARRFLQPPPCQTGHVHQRPQHRHLDVSVLSHHPPKKSRHRGCAFRTSFQTLAPGCTFEIISMMILVMVLLSAAEVSWENSVLSIRTWAHLHFHHCALMPRLPGLHNVLQVNVAALRESQHWFRHGVGCCKRECVTVHVFFSASDGLYLHAVQLSVGERRTKTTLVDLTCNDTQNEL